MTTSYKPLFSLQCSHSYFSDGVCRSLRLVPTTQCLGFLSRYGCLFRPDAQGGTLYGPSSPNWKSLSEIPPLSFSITDTGGRLASFTDTSTTATGAADATVRSFNNLIDYGTAPSPGSAMILLHPSGNAFAANPLTVYPPRFTYKLTSKQDSAALQIVDALGNAVWTPTSPTEGLTQIVVDISSLPDGRYQLRSKCAEPVDFYLTATPAATVWAFIDIFPAHLPPPSELPVELGICLAPRPSFWRYYVISQSPERTYQDYVITFGPALGATMNGTSEISFSGPVSETVNGRPAWVFESEQPIPLHQYPGEHYNISLCGRGRGQNISLPFAQPTTTRLDRQPDGTVRYCSEIFVYL